MLTLAYLTECRVGRTYFCHGPVLRLEPFVPRHSSLLTEILKHDVSCYSTILWRGLSMIRSSVRVAFKELYSFKYATVMGLTAQSLSTGIAA